MQLSSWGLAPIIASYKLKGVTADDTEAVAVTSFILTPIGVFWIDVPDNNTECDPCSVSVLTPTINFPGSVTVVVDADVLLNSTLLMEKLEEFAADPIAFFNSIYTPHLFNPASIGF